MQGSHEEKAKCCQEGVEEEKEGSQSQEEDLHSPNLGIGNLSFTSDENLIEHELEIESFESHELSKSDIHIEHKKFISEFRHFPYLCDDACITPCDDDIWFHVHYRSPCESHEETKYPLHDYSPSFYDESKIVMHECSTSLYDESL